MHEGSRFKVLAHVDLDAFYAQVEMKRNPELRGKPVGVVQYNPYGDLRTLRPDENRIFPDSNGSLIAVSYEARSHGVKRNMSGQQAKGACPDLNLVQVPVAHGKADLTIYREAGAQVITILSRLGICERASIDEAYLDVTEEASKRLQSCQDTAPPMPPSVQQIHVCGADEDLDSSAAWWSRPAELWDPADKLLACGASVVAELRAAVLAELGFSCSAGVAHYKLLSKLASGLHKPNQQTVVPAHAVPGLLNPLPVAKLRQLGGKFGEELVRTLGVQTVADLLAVPFQQLAGLYSDETAHWLTRLARGMDEEEVKPRMLPKSQGCGKTFRGRTALRSLDAVQKWLLELAQELQERLDADRALNERTPQLLTVAIDAGGSEQSASRGAGVSRSCRLRKPVAAAMAEDATALVKKWAAERPGWSIVGLAMTASNFTTAPTGASTITRFLQSHKSESRGSPVASSRPASCQAQPEPSFGATCTLSGAQPEHSYGATGAGSRASPDPCSPSATSRPRMPPAPSHPQVQSGRADATTPLLPTTSAHHLDVASHDAALPPQQAAATSSSRPCTLQHQGEQAYHDLTSPTTCTGLAASCDHMEARGDCHLEPGLPKAPQQLPSGCLDDAMTAPDDTPMIDLSLSLNPWLPGSIASQQQQQQQHMQQQQPGSQPMQGARQQQCNPSQQQQLQQSGLHATDRTAADQQPQQQPASYRAQGAPTMEQPPSSAADVLRPCHAWADVTGLVQADTAGAPISNPDSTLADEPRSAPCTLAGQPSSCLSTKGPSSQAQASWASNDATRRADGVGPMDHVSGQAGTSIAVDQPSASMAAAEDSSTREAAVAASAAASGQAPGPSTQHGGSGALQTLGRGHPASWQGLDPAEVDEACLAELPADIQREFRWAMMSRRAPAKAVPGVQRPGPHGRGAQRRPREAAQKDISAYFKEPSTKHQRC